MRGWDIASTAWAPYDERMPWGRQDGDSQLIDAVLLRAGARTIAIPADLADITAPACTPDARPAAPVTGPAQRAGWEIARPVEASKTCALAASTATVTMSPIRAAVRPWNLATTRCPSTCAVT